MRYSRSAVEPDERREEIVLTGEVPSPRGRRPAATSTRAARTDGYLLARGAALAKVEERLVARHLYGGA